MKKKKPSLSTMLTDSELNLQHQSPQTKQPITRTESMRNTAAKLYEFFTT